MPPCYLIRGLGDFRVGPAVKTLCSHCAGGVGSIPGQGTKIPHAVECGQEQQQKRGWRRDEITVVVSIQECPGGL